MSSSFIISVYITFSVLYDISSFMGSRNIYLTYSLKFTKNLEHSWKVPFHFVNFPLHHALATRQVFSCLCCNKCFQDGEREAIERYVPKDVKDWVRYVLSITKRQGQGKGGYWEICAKGCKGLGKGGKDREMEAIERYVLKVFISAYITISPIGFTYYIFNII